MASAVVPVALLVVVVNAVTGAVGAYLWWRVEDPTRAFGRLVRAGQALAGVLAVTSGVAALVDEPPDDGLFWVYALLPVAVSFVAEQLRVASAASERLEEHTSELQSRQYLVCRLLLANKNDT